MLSRRVVLTLIAAAAVLVLDAATPLGLAIWFIQAVLVWAATLWASRQQIILIATVCSTFIVLGFWLTSTAGPATWVDESNLLIGVGTVSAVVHSSLRRMATEEARRKSARELGQ